MPGMSFFKALENEKINKEEININTSVEFAELSGSFIGGEGDFVNLFEPLASKLENEGYGYVVASVGQSSDEFPYTAFYAKKSFIENNKDIINTFRNAIEKGMKYVKNNDSKTVAKVIKNQFSDTKVTDLANLIQRYKNADVWLDSPKVEKDFFNRLTNLLKDNNLINQKVYYKDLVINK